MTTQARIQAKLVEEFAPSHLDIINESHNHNVAPGSESHFKVIIVSEQFEGRPLVARHRSINKLLADELENGVHALSLHTKTPAEWENMNGSVRQSPPCLGGDKQS